MAEATALSQRPGDMESDKGQEQQDSTEVEEATSAQETFKSNIKKFKHDGNLLQSRLPFKGQPFPNATRKRPEKAISEDATSSPTPAKKRSRKLSGYAPPSQYAHLPKLTDILEPNLIGIFVGFNPGVTTATAGHAYAHPSNHFWRLLHSSGITDRRLPPEEDVTLPRLYQMGNTNLVDRASKNFGELSKKEMAAGTPILEEKVRAFKPESVCIVGKGIWESIWRWRYGREIKKAEFKYGWQDAKERMGRTKEWEGAWMFVATATSGLAANLSTAEKEAIWRPYGEWIEKRRGERGEKAGVESSKPLPERSEEVAAETYETESEPAEG